MMNDISNEIKRQRERACALKLKRWISYIESQENKTLDMKKKLTQYYRDLEELQNKRGGSRENASRQVINGLKNTIRKNTDY